MDGEQPTPLQTEIRRAVAESGKARDYYDSLLRARLSTQGKPLHDIDRGKSKKPKLDTLFAIEEVLSLPRGHLARLVYADVLVAQEPDQPVVRTVDRGETGAVIKIDLSLPMGPGATVDEYVEEEPLVFDLVYIQSFTRAPLHRLRIAQGVGDSMFPTLVSNDLVWIDTTQNELVHSDRIYAASINGGAAIKRLRPIAGGQRILVISDNKTIDAYEVDAADVQIWGRVIRFARDL